MALSGVSGVTAAYHRGGSSGRSGSLEAQQATLDAKIFDISTCTTTPPAQKATMLSNLNARKANLEQQMKQLDSQPAAAPTVARVPEGSKIHVIA
ncbi:hypothetical protein BH11MYX1_BH11MYX1_08910 [soil metagenome]